MFSLLWLSGCSLCSWHGVEFVAPIIMTAYTSVLFTHPAYLHGWVPRVPSSLENPNLVGSLV